MAGFAAVYLIWGSTYLAIRLAIETIPPFTMAGVRFVVAGGLIYAWARSAGVPNPERRHWKGAAVVGILLLLVGNGAVVWAEQWVPSGLVALLVATVPLWMVGIDWGWGTRSRPGPWVIAGIVWGLVGVALLVSTREIGAGTPQDLAGGLVVLGGSAAWAAGSIYSRHADLPSSPRMATAMQMLAGGVALLLAGALSGELQRLEAPTFRSALALAYLIVFGAVVGYTAYIWLLRVSTPARVSTYAYVNPVVALVLGWAVVDEPLTPRILLAGFVILTAVAVITIRSRKPLPAEAPEPTGVGD